MQLHFDDYLLYSHGVRIIKGLIADPSCAPVNFSLFNPNYLKCYAVSSPCGVQTNCWLMTQCFDQYALIAFRRALSIYHRSFSEPPLLIRDIISGEDGAVVWRHGFACSRYFTLIVAFYQPILWYLCLWERGTSSTSHHEDRAVKRGTFTSSFDEHVVRL